MNCSELAAVPFSQRTVYDDDFSTRSKCDRILSEHSTTCKTASNMQYALAAVDQGDTIRSAALRFDVAVQHYTIGYPEKFKKEQNADLLHT